MSVFDRGDYVEDVEGYCPICEQSVRFRSKEKWLRDFFLCSGCGSIPRERALMRVIRDYYPQYRTLAIHESSPGHRGVSVKLKRECPYYSASHYYSDVSPGTTHPKHGYRSENLEAMTFGDASFDLVITQDVMEHVLRPERAVREIARVLRPGGAHVFTVPLINKQRRSERWAVPDAGGGVVHLHEPEYHGNPIDNKGSLVTMHWGYDLADYIMMKAGTPTTMVFIDDMSMGIRAEYIEVMVSRKMESVEPL